MGLDRALDDSIIVFSKSKTAKNLIPTIPQGGEKK
jgi:hypothetical protein